MNGSNESTAWQYESAEQEALARHIIGLEKAALDKWFNGDTSGYEALWSRRSFTYFDAVVTERIDDHATIAAFLKTIDGKLFADSYDFRHPRVQIGQDMAVLTYQLFAKTSLIDMEYNCIEVYQKEEDGEWRVIHSTWSFIRPMDKDFKPAKEVGGLRPAGNGGGERFAPDRSHSGRPAAVLLRSVRTVRAAASAKRRSATPCSRVRPPQAAPRIEEYVQACSRTHLILNLEF